MSERSYHRFYACLKRMGCAGDEEVKLALVGSFTDGRTTSLREMTDGEYVEMCRQLEARSGWRDDVRRKRSVCLRLMQQLGVDTTDWSRVDGFCMDARIAGKVFARLGVKELEALGKKLRAILRKGGLGGGMPGFCGGASPFPGGASEVSGGVAGFGLGGELALAAMPGSDLPGTVAGQGERPS